MKPLTIEQLEALEVGDWVWITDADGDLGGYARKCVCFNENEFQYETIETYEAYNYADYGKTWLAYKNKEQAEAKGEIVELPEPFIETCINSYGETIYKVYQSYVETRCSNEEIFFTKEDAEEKLAELKGEKYDK